jgi:hypothetical protein
MGDYSFIQIDEGSAKFIKRLYSLCFHIRKSLSEIRTKYDTSMFGLRDTGFIAFDEKGTPGAYYGVFPIIITINDKDYTVAQSGDTMTAPLHRKKGLFIELARRTYELSKENKVEFLFGFPNESSYPGFKNKLNWEFYSCMQDFKIENKTLPLCELVEKFWILKPLYNKYCKLRLSRYRIVLDEAISRKFKNIYSVGYVKKDLNFFRYKERRAYLIDYKGFIIYFKAETHLIIGDVVHFEKDKTDQFLKILSLLAKKLGCQKTLLSLSKNHWLYSYLQEKLPSKESLPIGFLRFDRNLLFDQISFTRADYDTF